MGRRTGGGGGGMRMGRSSRPSNLPAKTAPPPPPVNPAPSAVAQPRQPGLFAHMASTAAGVAVGSAVGHTLGAAMTGGLGGSNSQVEQQQLEQAPAYQEAPKNSQNPCGFQLKQFLECAQAQSDITLCQGFNEALRECRSSYGI